jgi:tRNA pseudouridine38-40 synthase
VILNEKISTTGAGRTDTGVHAKMFCAHFDSVADDLDVKKNLIYRLNRFLPKDISVTRLRKVKSDSNARFSAISRTYKYYITREKNPFSEGSAWFIHGKMNVNAMNRAALLLLKYTDFTSFSKLHTDVKTNNCRIFEAVWNEDGSMLIFTIRADRFLRNMVRAIVGTMADIGREKKSLGEFKEIIESRDRCKAGKSAPAQGLFLTEIEYPEKIYI